MAIGTPARVLFIAAMGRSGSTLLDRVVGQVPGAVSIGEASQVWTGLRRGNHCGCGRPLRECPFWTEVVDRVFGGWSGVDVDRLLAMQRSVDRNRHLPLLTAPRRPAGFQADLDAYQRVLGNLYTAITEVSGASVVVDSGKHTSTAALLRHVQDIDLRTLHLIRDSRGVAYSWSKTVRRSEFDDALMDRIPTWKIARSWDVHNTLLAGLRRRRGPAADLLRYEDFVAEPRQRLEQVIRLAGLSPAAAAKPFVGPRQVDFAEVNHTLAGNPMRFRTGVVDIRLDDEWRTRLPEDERRRVTRITAPVLAAYGYRVRPAGPRARVGATA